MNQGKEPMYAGKEGWSAKWNYVLAALGLVLAFVVIAQQVSWGGHLLEWSNLIFRWFHIVIGIAWIGASFYFIWLENNLEREDVPEHLAGRLYSVHGGGFYHVEKYKVAPDPIPDKLHWFQWEAYLTWISGLGLLLIVYYANADLIMANSDLPLPGFVTIAIGLGTLALGWIVYDWMCRSELVETKARFAMTGFALVVVLAFVLSQVLSARAAYMHVGAMLGTLMAFNVFFSIIPAHRVMVAAARAGEAPDPSYAQQASLRSLHNNYMTLPVIFIMISNHFPSTFSYSYNWLVLALLFLASAGVRHYLNLHERGQQASWILPAASLMVLALALVTAPQLQASARVASESVAESVAFSDVHEIVTQRCSSCHAVHPSDPNFSSAPKGIVFDTPEQIAEQADLIYRNAVISDYMPLANMTGMLEEERVLLGRWIAQGAGAD